MLISYLELLERVYALLIDPRISPLDFCPHAPTTTCCLHVLSAAMPGLLPTTPIAVHKPEQKRMCSVFMCIES